jgi:hypothetical protein
MISSQCNGKARALSRAEAPGVLSRQEPIDLLIDCRGRAIRPGRRPLAYSVSKLGFIHIQMMDGVLIVTLQPELVAPLTMTGAISEIAHLQPERTIVVVANGNRISGDFRGHIGAIRKIGSLVGAATAGPAPPAPAAYADR